jgi:outer membrane immunogenic protein
MRRFLLAIISVFTIAAVAPAFAADQPVPKRKESAPRRTEPARTQTQTAKSNWDGGQVGGSNGTSSVNNNFVEPGAYVCPAAFPYT